MFWNVIKYFTARDLREHSSVHELFAKMRAQWIQIPSHMTNYFYLPRQQLQGILSLLALLSFVWVVPPQTDPPVPLGALCKVENIIVENISLKGVNLNVFYFCSLSLSFAICASPITLLAPPPLPPLTKKNICIGMSIVFNFSWDYCNAQEKLKTKVMQNKM